jgi:hypothetical protein
VSFRLGPIVELIAGLFWPSEPATQAAILVLLGLAAVAAVTVYGPLLIRLFQIGQLQRAIQSCFEDESSNTIQRQQVARAFGDSPLAYHWGDFVRRWQNAIAADPIQDATLPELSRAPVRLADVIAEHPLIPPGARRSLLPALPAIFLSAGLAGAFAGLVLALPGIGLSLDPPSFGATNRSEQVAALMQHLGMALRIGLWGLLLSLGAAISGRLIEGRAEIQSEALDSWVQLAYGFISSGELLTRTAHEQRAAIARLQDDLADLLRQVSGRPRPLIRSTAVIPGSAAPTGASSVDTEAIERRLTALGEQLSEQLDRTVAEQLGALRESLGGAIEGLGSQPSSSGELAEAALHLARTSESQEAASRSLTQTAHGVSDAAEELRSGLDDFADVVTQMRETSAALGLAAQRVEGPQAAASRLESTEPERPQRLDSRLDEMHTAVERLADRLEETLDTFLAAAPTSPETQHAPLPQPASQAFPEPVASPAEAATSPTSEADTIPYLKAPTPEMIYSTHGGEAESRTTGAATAAGSSVEATAAGTLSGLLRATHHSGPSSARYESHQDFDPAATVALDRHPPPEEAESDESTAGDREGRDAQTGGKADDDGDDASPRRRLFGRRK